MELKISGLKCDNCSYRDDSVPFEDYEKSVGKECPECGTNLLTEKEYQDCLKLYEGVDIYNRIGHALRWFNPMYYWRLVFGDNRETVTLSVKYSNKKDKK